MWTGLQLVLLPGDESHTEALPVVPPAPFVLRPSHAQQGFCHPVLGQTDLWGCIRERPGPDYEERGQRNRACSRRR